MLQRLTKDKLWASNEDIPYINGDKPRPGIKIGDKKLRMKLLMI